HDIRLEDGRYDTHLVTVRVRDPVVGTAEGTDDPAHLDLDGRLLEAFPSSRLGRALVWVDRAPRQLPPTFDVAHEEHAARLVPDEDGGARHEHVVVADLRAQRAHVLLHPHQEKRTGSSSSSCVDACPRMASATSSPHAKPSTLPWPE